MRPILPALCLCLLSACGAGQAMTGDLSSGGTWTSPAPDAVAYEAVAIAPDACWTATAAESHDATGDTLAIYRTMRREPGICAAVLTRIAFDGLIEGLAAAPARVEIVILDAAGRERQRFALTPGA
ncbi:MAG: hypothetical protein ACE37J_00235 [Pikeienuella sp.]|uniref:hypothetical protein n=1 Tax=Pikeienuella sp. TaxID=2831957 RepID=UPI003919314C